LISLPVKALAADVRQISPTQQTRQPVRHGEQVKKKKLQKAPSIQVVLPAVHSVTPNALSLTAGGEPVTATLTGSGLNRITSVKVIKDGKEVSHVTVQLGPSAPATREVTFTAKSRAPAGDYQVRLLAGNKVVDLNATVATVTVSTPPHRKTKSGKIKGEPEKTIPGPTRAVPQTPGTGEGVETRMQPLRAPLPSTGTSGAKKLVTQAEPLTESATPTRIVRAPSSSVVAGKTTQGTSPVREIESKTILGERVGAVSDKLSGELPGSGRSGTVMIDTVPLPEKPTLGSRESGLPGGDHGVSGGALDPFQDTGQQGTGPFDDLGQGLVTSKGGIGGQEQQGSSPFDFWGQGSTSGGRAGLSNPAKGSLPAGGGGAGDPRLMTGGTETTAHVDVMKDKSSSKGGGSIERVEFHITEKTTTVVTTVTGSDGSTSQSVHVRDRKTGEITESNTSDGDDSSDNGDSSDGDDSSDSGDSPDEGSSGGEDPEEQSSTPNPEGSSSTGRTWAQLTDDEKMELCRAFQSFRGGMMTPADPGQSSADACASDATGGIFKGFLRYAIGQTRLNPYINWGPQGSPQQDSPVVLPTGSGTGPGFQGGPPPPVDPDLRQPGTVTR